MMRNLMVARKGEVLDPQLAYVRFHAKAGKTLDAPVYTEARGTGIALTSVSLKPLPGQPSVYSAYYEGSGKSVATVAGNTIQQLGTLPFCIEAVFCDDTSNSALNLVTSMSPSNDLREWALSVVNGQLQFYHGTRGKNHLVLGANILVREVGKLHRVAVERDEFNQWWMYADNQVAKITAANVVNVNALSFVAGVNLNTPCPLKLGSIWVGYSATTKGFIDEARITAGSGRFRGTPMALTE